MGYTVTVDIKTSDFPELGNPTYPTSYSDVKDKLPKEIKTKVKDQFESYGNNASRARDIVTSAGCVMVIDRDRMNVKFDYEEGIPKTYKFLGMDIDDNYEAVILMGDGYIKVAPMYDSKEIAEASVSTYGGRFESNTIDMAKEIIVNSSQDLGRVLSTSMKNGALYDMFRKDSTEFDPFTGNNTPVKYDIADIKKLKIEHMDPLVQIIKNKMSGATGDANSSVRKFKSVLLNLVDNKEKKDQEAKFADSNNSQSTDIDSTVAAIILCKVFNYWMKVIRKYDQYFSTLSELDLWSNLAKTCMGDNAFNSKMMSTGAITVQNNDTGKIYPSKVLSFAGIARDNSTTDSNTIRASVSDSLSRLVTVASGETSNVEVVMQDLMLGNIDYEEFENPFDLSAEELQAVSSYDSLKYIDEDAQTCRESYNMNDPEDRSLFIKSAIKSYDRNFRAFKSRNDYDVAQAFSDMVENGVTFSDRIVSKDSLVDGPDLDSYEVTASKSSIDRTAIKKSLVKMGRLLNKSLTSINDQFGAVSQNP